MSTATLVEILRTSFDHDGSSTNIPLETFKSIEVKVMFMNLALISIKNSKYAIKRFLETKLAKREIRTLVITGVHASSLSEHIGAVLKFVAVSSVLQTIMFENIDGILPSHMKRLSAALAYSSSVRWFCMRCCSLGDNGFAALAPSLISRPLQVIVLESCALTDRSIGRIEAIIKGHESRMDSLAWGALLRTPAQDFQQLQNDGHVHNQRLSSKDKSTNLNGTALNMRADVAQALDRVADIHASGLVAINLKGNMLTSTSAVRLTLGLSYNRWLLGLNLSRNQLDSVGIISLATMLTINKALRVVVMEDNPGLEPHNREIVSTFSDGRSVLPYRLSEAVTLLLDRWKQLTKSEAISTATYSNATSCASLSRLLTSHSSPNRAYAASDDIASNRRDSTVPSDISSGVRSGSSIRRRVNTDQGSDSTQGDNQLQHQHTANNNVPRHCTTSIDIENENIGTSDSRQSEVVELASARAAPTLSGHPLLAKTVREQQQQSQSLAPSQKSAQFVPSAISSTDRAPTSPLSSRSQSQSHISFKGNALTTHLKEIDMNRARRGKAIKNDENEEAVDTDTVVRKEKVAGVHSADLVTNYGDLASSSR